MSLEVGTCDDAQHVVLHCVVSTMYTTLKSCILFLLCLTLRKLHFASVTVRNVCSTRSEDQPHSALQPVASDQTNNKQAVFSTAFCTKAYLNMFYRLANLALARRHSSRTCRRLSSRTRLAVLGCVQLLEPQQTHMSCLSGHQSSCALK